MSAPVNELATSEAVRVVSGAARLTERRPRWFWEVDLNRLDLESTTDCVLGQLWDSYDEGVDALSFDWPDDDRHHGFDAYADDYTPHAFSRLRQEWLRAISELRAANP